MSTEKSIKIQKNKVLTYAVNKPGFKTVYGSTLVNENKDINVKLYNLNTSDQDGDQGQPYKLGDRLFGISSFVDYFTPSGTYDVDSLKYLKISQTTGTSLTDLAVVKVTWLSQVETTLGIETPKGTSNDFIFTYDGENWNLTGATTQSNVDLEDYGISFTGTAISGDVITIEEIQYNKFAFFVLDANYRGNYIWGLNSVAIMSPANYTSNPQNCLESATYFNNIVFDNANLSSYAIFNTAKNLGNFILPNGIKINALIPNGKELQLIWDRKNDLDTFDPVTVANPSATYNLTNWDFDRSSSYGWYKRVWSCIEANGSNAWAINNSGTWDKQWYDGGIGDRTKNNSGYGFIPVFEVPVM